MVIKEKSLDNFLKSIGERAESGCNPTHILDEFVINIKHCTEMGLKVGDILTFKINDTGRRTGVPVNADEVFNIEAYDDLCFIAIKQNRNGK